MAQHVIRPDRLRSGDVIGIVAPSTPIDTALRAQVDQGAAFLRGLGFEVRFAPHVEARTLGHAASGAEKAVDLHAFFLDPDVKDDPAVYPDEATLNKLFTLTPLDTKAQRNLTRLWTKVLTGQ